MTKKEAISILGAISSEGFDYAFADFSTFEHVKDSEFHKRRRAYLTAKEDLEDMLFSIAGITCLEDLVNAKEEED